MRGQRQYELSNHLGNVLAVVSDQWKTNCTPVTVGEEVVFVYENYQSTVVQATDYSAFGAPLPGRTYVLSASFKSRYGFNGQEMDDEVAGERNTYTAEFWEYDARIGRRFNMDPKPNPSISNYSCFSNNPIWFIDPKGDTCWVRNGRTNQALTDLRSIVDPLNYNRITTGNVTNPLDPNFTQFLQVNSVGYVPGSDAGMDLLMSLTNPSIDALFDASATYRINGSYSLNPITTNQTCQYGGNGTMLGTEYATSSGATGAGKEGNSNPKPIGQTPTGAKLDAANGDYPQTRIVGMASTPTGFVPTSNQLNFQVGIHPDTQFYTDDNKLTKCPRAIGVFVLLQTAYLNSTDVNMVSKKPEEANSQAIKIAQSSSYRGLGSKPGGGAIRKPGYSKF